MEPIIGTHWVIANGVEWGLAVEGDNVHLIERVDGAWKVMRSWLAPVSDFRAWIRVSLIPFLSVALLKRLGDAPAPIVVPAETLAQVLGSSILYNYTSRSFAYIPPADPDNV